MKLTKLLRVQLPLGLHARPATSLVQMLAGTDCSVTLKHEERTADAKSVMEILMLAVKPDSDIEVTVEGEDAPSVMERLINAFEEGLEPDS